MYEDRDRIPHGDTRAETVSGPPAAAPVDRDVPVSIGDYRIRGVLGRGGMGVVYEAEQQSPKRVVALKVIRGDGTVDDLRVAMFRREVEVLARLEHPMIARIYESGRTPEGRYFFAMELVRGATLSEFLRRQPGPLDGHEVRSRLTLLADIAEAVHYAHQRGVIHRDLKPSNLVVTEDDPESGATGSGVGGPRVKILDFGLARITDGDVNATRVTEIGMIKGTLPYMSPEQARGRPDEIDLRSDVYALGVILYEMLAGTLPHDLSSPSIADALRIIERARPVPLRSVWKGVRRLEADLETIVAKALEKEAGERYGSAAALAEDLRRYLTSLPILARPPSAVDQLRKLVRRNPLPTAFVGALLVLLVAFAGTMAYQARRIAQERDRAAGEAAKATAINQFLLQTLETPNPYAGGERQITVLEALDKALPRVAKDFAGQPLVEAAVLDTLGTTFVDLGQFEKAEPLIRRSLELRLEQLGPHHGDTATAWGKLSRLQHNVGRYDEAIASAQAGIDAQRIAGPTDAKLGERLNDLGFAYFFAGKPDEAEKPILEAIEIGRAQPGGPTYTLGESLRVMGDILVSRGKLDEAAKYAGESLELLQATLGPDHPMVNQARNSLGLILMQKGDFAGAEKLLLEVLERARKQLGDKNPLVAVALENLGNVYFRQQQLDRTIELLREAAALRKEALGPKDPAVGRTYANMGTVMWRAGRLEESEAAYREGLTLMRDGLGPDHPDVASVLMYFGGVMDKRGDRSGAEGAMREALRIRRTALGDEQTATAQSMVDLGLHLASRGLRTAEARTLLQDGVAILAATAGEDDPRIKAAREALAGFR